ncbi:MAG: DUF4926 domain-containing protein [Leptospiraceae bacterium]|nr:DUF4926 domain-containing protein [Leptospiraceae bacterium]
MEEIGNTFKLYSLVSLKKDIPEYNLKKGDVGTLIDIVKHPEKEDGAVLEFFNALGDSIKVIAISILSIDNLHENEILSVRSLDKQVA